MTIQSFMLTKTPKQLVALIRWVLKMLGKIPIVGIVLVIVSKVCYSLLNDILFAINAGIADYKGELDPFLKSNAVMNDKKLNVAGQYTLNAVMIKGEAEPSLKFGNQFSTVSDQMGRLPQMTKFGTWCKDVFLDTLEKDHCAKAVQLNNNALIKRVTELQLL